MFFVHSTQEKFKNATITGHLGKAGVFEKLRFRDGLVWMKGLTVEIKLRSVKTGMSEN